jgi:hypothetical protein
MLQVRADHCSRSRNERGHGGTGATETTGGTGARRGHRGQGGNPHVWTRDRSTKDTGDRGHRRESR